MSVPDNSRETLLRYLRVQQATDAEIRRLLRRAARDLAFVVEGSAPTGFGDAIRRAQLRFHTNEVSKRLWQGTGREITAGQQRSIDVAARGARRDLASLLLGLPANVRDDLIRATEKAAEMAVDRAIARLGGREARELSASVYRHYALMNGDVDRLVNSGIARGLSAREMAAEVRRYILPTTPGGASYAAMRLSRTELNNSYHSASTAYWQDSPFVTGMKWNLSSSHPRADVCNEYATEDHDHLGAGVFRNGNTPSKPHPQCLCYVVPSTPDDDEIVRQFNSGKYDEFLAKQGVLPEAV